jgi:hypothetical protein
MMMAVKVTDDLHHAKKIYPACFFIKPGPNDEPKSKLIYIPKKPDKNQFVLSSK